MDVYKALFELYEEKKRLDAVIHALESRNAPQAKGESRTRGRRGRRSMGMEEREEVSRRMSRYWAARRAKKQAAAGGAVQGAHAADTSRVHAQGATA